MSVSKRIQHVYQSAKEIPFDDSSRFIILSDCHRGDGSWADNFSKNQNLFFAALTHYYKTGYTYIELGDGDELWENKHLSSIMSAHSDAFWLMSKFYNHGRLYLIYGNHDIVKRNSEYIKAHFAYSCDEHVKKRCVPLFPHIELHEGLVLRHRKNKGEILLLHGHQADFFNDKLWRLSRFFVRYLWRPLELIGVRDPTSTAKNYERKALVEKKLIQWTVKEKQMIIAGHTHRSIFPDSDTPPYFNDGCCVHPRCITGIEIADGEILLVKWSLKTKPDGTVYVGRDILEGPNALAPYMQISE